MSKDETNFQAGLLAIGRHILPFKRELAILGVLGLFSAAANGFVPYLTGRFFDSLVDLTSGSGSYRPLVLTLSVWATAQLAAVLIDWFISRLRRRVDAKTQANIQTEGFIHLLRLPVGFHKNEKINELVSRVSMASWRVASIVGQSAKIGPQILSVVIGGALAASISPLLASILVFGVLVYLVLLFLILRPVASMDTEAHKAWNEAWGDAAAAVQQIESVKQASSEGYEIEKVNKDLRGRAYELWYKLEKIWSNVSFFQHLVVFTTQLTIFVLSVHLVSTGAISIGDLVALSGYSLMFFGPFVELGYQWQTIQNGITSAGQADRVFRETPETYQPTGGKKPIANEVSFEHVFFRYSAKEPEILSDINFKVGEGEALALVGSSGVGKSTLVSLISGYYFPTAGKVLIGGVETRNQDLYSLRKQIAVVPQEVALFNDTLLENIRYGTFEATTDEVRETVAKAHLADFVESLPQGYQTLVGERGVKLSVGQKQRVSIARAILRNPKILILDEPTSALDAETEKYVTESLEELMRGRITFIIAHRLSTVRRADRILFLGGGRVVEEGSHAELMKISDGKYRKMYELHVHAGRDDEETGLE